MKIGNLVRKEVLQLSPYEVRVADSRNNLKVVKADLNENFAVDGDVMVKLLLEACRDIDLRIYSPPYGDLAAEAIAGFLGLRNFEISVANGADDLLDLLMKVFVRGDSRVLVVEPTFSMYTYYARLYGGRKVAVLLRPNFDLDIDSILKNADEKTRMLIVCSPNNPTGNQFRQGEIEEILQRFEGVVVVDEAYVDFADYSLVDRIREFDNLIVLRSFSKAFGLAGIRLGFMVSNKEISQYVRRVTSPFNVNTVTQQVVVLALKRWNYFKRKVQSVIEEREWLRTRLSKIDGITPYPSEANFILFKLTGNNWSSAKVTRRLARRNVLVKDRGKLPLLSNCIRVTVGTREMNETFLSALREAMEEQ